MMNLRIRQPFTATPRRQAGSVSVLMVIALAAILMMAGLSLDVGHMLLNKTRLQNAVDAAALSGAKTLSQVEGGSNPASVTRTAALNTLAQNANAMGNSELATAMVGNAGFAVAELASSVYGAGTLQTTARSDPKAIAEMETLLGELLALYRSTAKEASTPEPPASTPAAP